MSHLNFCPTKVAYLVTLFDRKLQIFKNSPKLTIFWVFLINSKCKRMLNATFSIIFKHCDIVFSSEKKEMTETHWTSLPSLMTTFLLPFFTITKYCDSTVKKTPSSLVAPLYVISYQSLGVGRAVGSIMASSTILDSPSIMMMQY